MSDGHADRARFTAMTEGTAEDWQIISSHFLPFAAQVGTRVLDHLRLLDGDYGGFPIDRLQHSLQTATRAHHPDLEQTVTAAVGRRTNSVTPASGRRTNSVTPASGGRTNSVTPASGGGEPPPSPRP